MLKITEKKRQRAIEELKKSMMKEAKNNNIKLGKGQTNGNTIYYLDGYVLYNTNENIGVEALPESESINCKNLLPFEKIGYKVVVDYDNLCKYIQKATKYFRKNNIRKRSEKRIYYPIKNQNNNNVVWFNPNNLKMILELTKNCNVEITKSNMPLIIRPDINGQNAGLITPCRVVFTDTEIAIYNTIQNIEL